jgi:hypothetical protein
VIACESRGTRDDQPVDFRSNSGGRSPVEAGATIPDASDAVTTSDARVGPRAVRAIVPYSPCSTADETAHTVHESVPYTCRCVATHSGSLVWDCAQVEHIPGGPLPPPALDELA